ncbi:acyl carrier protein [Streptomyces sp. NA02950]|uniref:phosphopantetheine-binding protein n=1 Tax=Streptomyces sp. NA02950 TaxID=2742137 RepID=UPI00158FF901|nr:phosphopantetheine-binding protein [Streptomyces sp. NA02950]QKV91855.1 acyl carrier protein [Streptomyces sp. NA02950]
MPTQLSYAELAALMKSCAGLTVDPQLLETRPDATFEEYGLDSLGLLAIVGELENRYGTPIEPGAESSKTPGDFLDVINTSLTTGA